MPLNAPVLLIVFNRPDTARLVINAISAVQPRQIFIAADGPRWNFPNDVLRCGETRDLIKLINWPCEVRTLFHEENQGCRNAPVSAINWFFENVGQGIILEDDCLPDKSFFYYCEDLLNQYRDDKRIMSIAGTNLLGEWKSDYQDYHFTHYSQIWGWATWKRAWELFNPDIKLWKEHYIKEKIKNIILNNTQYKLSAKYFDTIVSEEIDVWDYQWLFANLIHSGLTIIPSVNLVSNIGFSADATHTKLFYENISAKKTGTILTPLRPNHNVVPDREYEKNIVDLHSNLRIKHIFNRKFIKSIFHYLFSLIK